MGLLKADEKELEKLERSKWKRVGLTLLKDWRLYVLLFPMLLFLFLFKYMPIYGVLQGFKMINNTKGVLAQQWQGLYYLNQMFDTTTIAGQEFWRAFRNTFVNSMYGLLFGFPIPIFIALFFTEIKSSIVRSVVQVCVYLPKFLSTIVTATIVTAMCAGYTKSGADTFAPGLITKMMEGLKLVQVDESTGHTGQSLLNIPRFFRPIYQITGIWEGAGYGSIVYFAAALSISPSNYEAARIDGASKMQQIKYVTLPGMTPTLAIMLIIRVGQILHVGYEKVILLYTDATYETADVISTWVYRKMDLPAQQALGVIGGLLESLISMVLVLGANAISRRVSNTSLF